MFIRCVKWHCHICIVNAMENMLSHMFRHTVSQAGDTLTCVLTNSRLAFLKIKTQIHQMDSINILDLTLWYTIKNLGVQSSNLQFQLKNKQTNKQKKLISNRMSLYHILISFTTCFSGTGAWRTIPDKQDSDCEVKCSLGVLLQLQIRPLNCICCQFVLDQPR